MTAKTAKRKLAGKDTHMSGAHIVCEALLQAGVDTMFGIPGATLMPLYDVLLDYPFHHVLVRHEQAAAHAADGYARATGRVGVCLATSGPGATNLVTGLATAHLDSSPMVAITAQVPTHYIGKDAFQEVDITGITLPITKHNYLVEDVEDVARVMKEAFYLANSGRPGPVLVDLPKDILSAHTQWDPDQAMRMPGYKPTLFGHRAQVKRAASLINRAHRPLIIAGRGVLIAGATAELLNLAETAQVPVATTLLGVSSFPEEHELALGMLGMHGEIAANRAVAECDVLVALGMRYDDRATGKLSCFAPNAEIIHVDVDPAEIGKNVAVNVPIVGDVKNVLVVINSEVKPATHKTWLDEIEALKSKSSSGAAADSIPAPEYIIRTLHDKTDGKAIIVTDVGQNQMWAAKNYGFSEPNTFISSGGLGTMGFSVPAALGAQIGRPDHQVWAVAGDGGFQMNIQELATIKQEGAPVKMMILNNGYLGMVRQFQQLFYGSRYSHTKITGPDYVKLGAAYDIPAVRVEKTRDVAAALEKAVSTPSSYIVEFIIEPEANVFPMIPPGASVDDALFDEDAE
jgi:acetolactate synthase I/II/III large subunit